MENSSGTIAGQSALVAGWKKFSSALDKFEGYFSGLSLVIGTVLMIYQVIARYFLNRATAFAEEWVPFMVVWSAILASSILINKDGHISVELLRDILKRKSRSNEELLKLFFNILIIFFSIIFFRSSISMVQDALQTGMISDSRAHTPMWLPYLIMPLGVGLMLLRTVEKVFENIAVLAKSPGWYKSKFLLILLGIIAVCIALIFMQSVPLALLFSLLFILIFLGLPISFSLGLCSIIVILRFNLINTLGISNKFFWSINKYALMPLPFFLLSGNMMAKGKLGEYLLNFANSFLRPFRGGIGMAVIGAATIFGAISGASAASAAAIGAMALPILDRQKYPKSFGAGLIAAGGTLAVIIPPSGVLVLYGAIAGESTTDLFLAGIVPGLVIAAILSLYIFIVCSVRGYGLPEKFSLKEIARSFKKAFWALLLPVGILVPIYTGIATPTEVAAVSCLYALILCIFVYRDVTWKQMIDIVIDSAVVSAMIFFITMTASLFAFLVAYEQLPRVIFQMIVAANMNWWQFLMLFNLVVFIMGFFLNPNAIMLISIPIVLPVCKLLNIDAIHVGILMTVGIQLAFLTPPVGMNLYVLARISKLPLVDVIRGVVPFVGILLLCLVFLTFFPGISTFLVR